MCMLLCILSYSVSRVIALLEISPTTAEQTRSTRIKLFTTALLRIAPITLNTWLCIKSQEWPPVSEMSFRLPSWIHGFCTTWLSEKWEKKVNNSKTAMLDTLAKCFRSSSETRTMFWGKESVNKRSAALSRSHLLAGQAQWHGLRKPATNLNIYC